MHSKSTAFKSIPKNIFATTHSKEFFYEKIPTGLGH